MTDLRGLLHLLVEGRIEFFIVGGVAATIHGSARVTRDLDVIEVEAFGLRCLCLDLDTLIRVKRAAGRPRDLEAIAELRVIREERERSC